MNRTILKPLQLRKRFIAALAALFAIFILAGLFAACGNDDNVTGGNDVVTPVFSIDSLVLRTLAPGSSDTVFNIDFTADLDSFKMQFTLEANNENMFTALELNIIDSNTNIFAYTFRQGEVNEAYTHLLVSSFGSCNKRINAKFTVNGNGNVDKYLIMRNFKLYRLN